MKSSGLEELMGSKGVKKGDQTLQHSLPLQRHQARGVWHGQGWPVWLHLFPGAGTGCRQLVSYNTQKTKMRDRITRAVCMAVSYWTKLKKKRQLERSTKER